jgi:putative nucleotidyltransferase with HDIG domain
MNRILDQRLKPSNIIAPALGDEDEGYVPLPLRLLPADCEVPFSIFIKVKNKEDLDPTFTAVCSEGQAFHAAWHAQLGEMKVPWVYFLQDDEEKALGFIDHNLKNLLADDRLANENKASLIYDITIIWMRHFYKAESFRTGQRVGLAMRYIDSLYDLINQDRTSSGFVMDIWRHEFSLYAHSLNLCLLGLAFVTYLGWTNLEARAFGMGALLHDIGKTQVPGQILNKNSPLSPDEWDTIKRHPGVGFRMLKNFTGLRREVLLMVLQHHENGDGSGYPDGLKLDNIHPWARILRILDGYEAMTSPRPWRNAFPPTNALWGMREEWEKSTSYDPGYLKAFIKFLAGL